MSAPPDPFPGHDGGTWAPVPCRVAASWPAGHFAENLAVDAAGAVFVSLHSHSRVDRYDPATGAVQPFAHLPAPVMGLAFDAAGTLWATGGTPGQPPGLVWRIAGGEVTDWAQVANAPFLNGCTPHPDGRTLLACDSMTGRVLGVDMRERGAWWTSIADDRLRPVDAQMPGANGIKVRDGALWVSVTGRSTLLRAPLLADGSAAMLEIAAANLLADDFAFAPDGALLAATHPAHTVLRLAADGTRTTLAGPEQGAAGSTACAFGRAAGDAGALYVTTNGGMMAPWRGVVQEAKLLRLEMG